MPRTLRSSRTRRLGAVALAVGLLTAAACSNADSEDSEKTTTTSAATSSTASGGTGAANVPGVTSDEIKFAMIGTRSNNPLGTCVLDCFQQGVQAYFDYRNSEGGVDGRKLVISTTLDDELSKNQERALEVVTANDTFATFNASQIGSGYAEFAKANIPLYTWTLDAAAMSGQENIFGNREVPCVDCTKRGDAYVAQLAGAEKVATLGYGVSESSKLCAQAAAEGIDQYSEDIGGATTVYTNDNLSFGLPNGIGPEVTAMKDAGVQLIIGCIDLNGMKTLAQELQRQGMQDVTLYHLNTYDQEFISAGGDLFVGDYVSAPFRPFQATPIPASEAYQKWMEKSGNKESEMSMFGWINADLAYQGLKAAGSDFDRQKVIDATNKMTEYTASGLVFPIDWSRQHEPATQDDPATHGPEFDCVAIVKVDKSGEFQVAGDKDKPFECWPGDTRDWSEPTAMSFE